VPDEPEAGRHIDTRRSAEVAGGRPLAPAKRLELSAAIVLLSEQVRP